MGSVISTCECPHCKSEATEDYYYKTGEVYVMCSCCGYYLEHSLDRVNLRKDGIDLLEDITEKYWIKKEIIPVASYTEQFKKFSRLSTIETGTVEDLIKELQQNKDNIKSNPEYENILVNWYDGKSFYQYDLNNNETKLMACI